MTEGRWRATPDRPERFLVFVCPDPDCLEWWDASHGSGRCGNHEAHPEGDYPEMRSIILIAESDCDQRIRELRPSPPDPGAWLA